MNRINLSLLQDCFVLQEDLQRQRISDEKGLIAWLEICVIYPWYTAAVERLLNSLEDQLSSVTFAQCEQGSSPSFYNNNLYQFRSGEDLQLGFDSNQG